MNRYKISKERRSEIDFFYKEFNKKKNGLDGKQVLYMLNSIGIYPSKQEVEALIEESKINGNIMYKNFFAIMQEVYYDENIGKLLYSSLKAHTNPDAQGINANELKHLLMTLGSGVKLTEDEVDAFLNIEFNANKNKDILFDEFIHKVLKE